MRVANYFTIAREMVTGIIVFTEAICPETLPVYKTPCKTIPCIIEELVKIKALVSQLADRQLLFIMYGNNGYGLPQGIKQIQAARTYTVWENDFSVFIRRVRNNIYLFSFCSYFIDL